MTFLKGFTKGDVFMFGFENRVTCAQCGGKCCKGMPGIASPEDFGSDIKDGLYAALKSGKWAIDWWEGDPRPDRDELVRAYHIRPATKRATRLYDPSWGGECAFLTDAGCELPFDARPYACRMLEPKGVGCVAHGMDKQALSIAWIPYIDIIEEIGDALTANGR